MSRHIVYTRSTHVCTGGHRYTVDARTDAMWVGTTKAEVRDAADAHTHTHTHTHDEHTPDNVNARQR